MSGGWGYNDIKGMYLCCTSGLWEEPFPQPTITSITQLMNHTGLKADNKGPGTFSEKRVLALICHIPCLPCCAPCVYCANLLDGDGNYSCYLCVLLLELLWAQTEASSLGHRGNPIRALALNNRYPCCHFSLMQIERHLRTYSHTHSH